MMYFQIFQSPIGCLRVLSNGRAIVSVQKVSNSHPENSEPDQFTAQCIRELEEYFTGKRKSFDVPTDISSSSEFYRQVWNALKEVPYGQTRSYMQIAEAINNPGAVRAVGLANGKNPIPIIIPCHRIIGSDGSLVGYGMGLDIKKQLLMLENPRVFGVQKMLF